jgi:hypothetical protein
MPTEAGEDSSFNSSLMLDRLPQGVDRIALPQTGRPTILPHAGSSRQASLQAKAHERSRRSTLLSFQRPNRRDEPSSDNKKPPTRARGPQNGDTGSYPLARRHSSRRVTGSCVALSGGLRMVPDGLWVSNTQTQLTFGFACRRSGPTQLEAQLEAQLWAQLWAQLGSILGNAHEAPFAGLDERPGHPFARHVELVGRLTIEPHTALCDQTSDLARGEPEPVREGGG